MSFLSQLITDEGGSVRFVTGVERGNLAWYFIELNPESYLEYKENIRKQTLKLADFGKILASGWGKKPPPEIIQRMKTLHDVKCD